MGEDISTGAKIGIILCILVFLIAIIFSLLTIVRNITNTEASQMQNGLDQMSESQFNDYDQKTVTGTQVMSALKIFEGQNVALVIQTSQSAEKSAKQKGGYNYGALVIAADATNTNTFPGKIESEDNLGVTCLINQGVLKAESGFYRANLMNKNGNYQFNWNVRPCGQSGTDTYVRSSGKFFAQLIKDSTDTIVGIVFRQLNKDGEFALVE